MTGLGAVRGPMAGLLRHNKGRMETRRRPRVNHPSRLQIPAASGGPVNRAGVIRACPPHSIPGCQWPALARSMLVYRAGVSKTAFPGEKLAISRSN